MNKQTSLYLDLLRIAAALVVFLSHLQRSSLSRDNTLVLIFARYGQEGVAMFFVISGVVIAYVARNRKSNLRDFFVARIGRLWSVMLPALVLTIVLDVVGRIISPEMYSDPKFHPWGFDWASMWNFISPALFLNKSSFGEVIPGTNGPFWSLCYEFWYYAIFAFAYYLRGMKRGIALIIACLIAGINVLLLFPIWCMGLLTYMYLNRYSSKFIASFIWVVTIGAMLLTMFFKHKIAILLVAIFPDQGWTITDVSVFISRFVIGAFVAINIVAFDRMGSVNFIKRFEFPIRYVASRSFSLYLYQAPLLIFFGALTVAMESAMLRLTIIVIATLVSVIVLSDFTEKRKDLFTQLADYLLPKNRVTGTNVI